MAGGQGTRLWPLSRQKRPKQLQSFVSDKSLIRETFERLLPKFKPEEIYISTTPEYLDEMKKQLPELAGENYIIEPFPMNTAAACGLATIVIGQHDKEAIIAFLPSDHTVRDGQKFLDIISFCESLCLKNPEKILTIGINPTKPDTGLGYIQMDSQFEKSDGLRAFTVKKFIEKPSLEKAQLYLASWEYLWNAGIFIWKASTMLQYYKKFLPNTSNAMGKISKAWGKKDQEKVLKNEYKKVDNTSVDYGILEKTSDILVIPGDFGWSDIGSWGTLLEVLRETHKTSFISRGHHIGVNDTNSLIFAGEKLIATVGLKDIIIIDTPDALLICNSKQSHDVKELLNKLKAEGKHFYL